MEEISQVSTNEPSYKPSWAELNPIRGWILCLGGFPDSSRIFGRDNLLVCDKRPVIRSV